MGNITTVKMLNDYVDDIEKDENFQAVLADMLRTGQTGEVITGVKIIDSRHTDETLRVRIFSELKDIAEEDRTKAEKRILKILEE